MNKFLFLVLIFFSSFSSFSCDRSSVSLVGVTPGPAGTFVITYQICVGEGIFGTMKGADSDTRTFAIGIYSSSAITVSAFTPAAIVGTSTGTVQTGALFGPQGPPFDSQETIAYIDPGAPNAFACVSSTVVCGTPNTRCDTYSFTSSVIPDSLRVFGIEGSGNPISGCTSDNDMLIDFSIALQVEWGSISAINLDKRNAELRWSTISETNNDYFVVQKLEQNQHAWWDMATIDGQGTTSSETNYLYTDEHVSNGVNYYRVKQYDFDGNYTLSETVYILKNYEGYVPFKAYPNPTGDVFKLEGVKNSDVKVMSSDGRLVSTFFAEENSFSMDVSHFQKGFYLIFIEDGEEQRTVKLLVEH